jgi:hypothetical protein
MAANSKAVGLVKIERQPYSTAENSGMTLSGKLPSGPATQSDGSFLHRFLRLKNYRQKHRQISLLPRVRFRSSGDALHEINDLWKEGSSIDNAPQTINELCKRGKTPGASS